ncbi:MAG: 6-phosphofructokinase [Gammaproteobacteria bacterium]|nr:6-phosphofructokinase [Gammaproteobacteria bacterium]
MKKIIVLTSGGDAPGMNAAIRAVVRTGHYYGLKVYGCQFGFQGLVDQTIFPMEPNSVANMIQNGGTILKTARCLSFLQKETRDACRAFLKKEEIDGIVVIGGNGSFKGASLLTAEGGPATIGIPGTIDNDIHGTEYTIGFDTARNTALQAIDKIRDTASSHNHNFLVEVMGRSSGFLALDVGIAGGAEFILTPEFPVSHEVLASKITTPRRHKLSSIIVIAEADKSGRSFDIAKQLAVITGLQYRVCILGHTQRGGSPTAMDRKMASEMGYLAVRGLLEGQSHQMTAFNQGRLELVRIPDPDLGPRILNQKDLIELNDILCT